MLLVVPLRPADLASRKQAGLPISVLTAWDAISAAVVTEAGAGAVSMMRAIKQALDPKNIMNPGKIFLD